VVADEELLAVVEPLNPFATVDQIRAEIEISRAQAVVDEDEDEEDVDIDLEHDHEGIEEIEPTPPPSPEEIRAGFARIASRLAKVG
jgi:hypothetical protein